MSSLSLPTDQADWRLMGQTVRRVLGQPLWLLVALVLSILTVAMFVMFDAPIYVRTVVFGGEMPIYNRILAAGTLFPLVGNNGTFLRSVLIYSTAVAIGTNLAVLGHHLRRGLVGLRDSSGGLAGAVIGMLGAGCAPCGAAVFAGVVSVTGVAVGLAMFPLQGAEFLLVSLVVSVLSLFWIASAARPGEINDCPVNG